jgi:hypothetical protein
MSDAFDGKAVTLVAVGWCNVVASSTAVARYDGLDSQGFSLLPPFLGSCSVTGVKPAFRVLSVF